MSRSSSISSTSNSSATTCSICLNAVLKSGDRSIVRLQCSHLFHLDCIGSAFNSSGKMQCPNCRRIEDGEWHRFDTRIRAQRSPNNEPTMVVELEATSPQFVRLWHSFTNSSLRQFHISRSTDSLSQLLQQLQPSRLETSNSSSNIAPGTDLASVGTARRHRLIRILRTNNVHRTWPLGMQPQPNSSSTAMRSGLPSQAAVAGTRRTVRVSRTLSVRYQSEQEVTQPRQPEPTISDSSSQSGTSLRVVRRRHS
ncbi:hypothetical protein ACFE04_000098 [Oxalis oulophora]